jgi:hypothetical protein
MGAKDFEALKYFLYIADVILYDFIERCINIGGAKAIVANIDFQEELFNLEHAVVPMINRIILCRLLLIFIIITFIRKQTVCVDYGILIHILGKNGYCHWHRAENL